MKYSKNVLRLMCPWGFNPAKWGGIGFSDEAVQNKLAQEKPIVAIYITRDSPLATEKQGMVVGFVELSGKIGDISKFISWEALVEHLENAENQDRWPYAVGMSRAWKVIPENWQDVTAIFPNTYEINNPRNIGSSTVFVEEDNFDEMNRLGIEAVAVYQQDLRLEEYATVGDLLTSRGVLIG